MESGSRGVFFGEDVLIIVDQRMGKKCVHELVGLYGEVWCGMIFTLQSYCSSLLSLGLARVVGENKNKE